jgi:predicted Mrr-cat superfamily restriction endonuclease
VCVIGWSQLGAIATTASRNDLKDKIADVYGAASAASLASQAGQIYRFVHDVTGGDLVILPLMTAPGHVAVGRIGGE